VYNTLFLKMEGCCMKKILAIFFMSFALLAKAGEDGFESTLACSAEGYIAPDETVCDGEDCCHAAADEKDEDEKDRTKSGVLEKVLVGTGKGIVGCFKLYSSFMFGVGVGLAGSVVHRAIKENGLFVPAWPQYCPTQYKYRVLPSEYRWRLAPTRFEIPSHVTHKTVAGSAAALSLLPTLTFGPSGLAAIAGTAAGYAMYWGAFMDETEYNRK
jgi:hypothetical protein